jgi:hypothetical protein
MANTNEEKKQKLPKHYFCINDMTSSSEVEECILQECESAGLEITEDEDLAEERGYDRAFEVINPYKNKLEKIKKILKTNIKQWDETQHDPVEEFKLLVEMIDEE